MKTTTAKRAPTKAEIKAEIKKLKDMKKHVPEFNFFRDSNHHEIEAQIYVLKNDIDHDEIAERYLPKGGDGEPTDLERSAGITIEAESAGRDARNWMDGEEADAPSKGWESLAVKGGYKPKKT